MAIFNLTYDAVKDLYTGTVGSYNGGGACYVTALFNSGSPVANGLRLFNSEAGYPNNYFASGFTQQINGTPIWTGSITTGLVSPSTMTWTIRSDGETDPTFNDNVSGSTRTFIDENNNFFSTVLNDGRFVKILPAEYNNSGAFRIYANLENFNAGQESLSRSLTRTDTGGGTFTYEASDNFNTTFTIAFNGSNYTLNDPTTGTNGGGGTVEPTNTPDIETDAKITSDLLRTTADGGKYALAKAVNYSSANGTITITLDEQEVILDITPSALAGFLTSSDITNFITSSDIADFLTESEVGALITTALSTYSNSSAIQTLIADFLKASDLDNLTTDVITTGNVEAAVLKAGTAIQFANGGSIVPMGA